MGEWLPPGERRRKEGEDEWAALFLSHPAHISGSMTEMDEGAAEVSGTVMM